MTSAANSLAPLAEEKRSSCLSLTVCVWPWTRWPWPWLLFTSVCWHALEQWRGER